MKFIVFTLLFVSCAVHGGLTDSTVARLESILTQFKKYLTPPAQVDIDRLIKDINDLGDAVEARNKQGIQTALQNGIKTTDHLIPLLPSELKSAAQQFKQANQDVLDDYSKGKYSIPTLKGYMFVITNKLEAAYKQYAKDH